MKIEQKHRRGTLLIASWLLIAIVLGTAAPLRSDDERRDTSTSATEEAQRIKRNEEHAQTKNAREPTGLVGPSAEEIHDFLYPPIQDEKAVTRPTG
jgi:hypothetical protein